VVGSVRTLLQKDSFDEDCPGRAIVAMFDRRGTMQPSNVPVGLNIAYSADAGACRTLVSMRARSHII
jgi:hypothetical protein